MSASHWLASFEKMHEEKYERLRAKLEGIENEIASLQVKNEKQRVNIGTLHQQLTQATEQAQSEETSPLEEITELIEAFYHEIEPIIEFSVWRDKPIDIAKAEGEKETFVVTCPDCRTPSIIRYANDPKMLLTYKSHIINKHFKNQTNRKRRDSTNSFNCQL